MFFKNTGIFYYFLKKKSSANSNHITVSQNNENLRGNLANVHSLHCMVKEDFFYRYRFFLNQSACGGR
jgi:hypothetical protein